MNKIKIYSAIVSLSLAIACGESDDSIQNQYLISSQIISERSASNIEVILTLSGLENLNAYVEHDIVWYEIEYETTYLDESIVASGLVSFPVSEEAMPMLSFQHGTITANSSAPTEDEQYSLLASLAGAGYIFLAPDLIGFGSSEDILHPYYHKELTARAVIDMILATEELARQEGFSFNGELFLAGYSEGGYATMVTHQAIESESLEGIELMASAPASGGYDIKGMQEYFFSLESYNQPFYLAYVALSYLSVYEGWNLEIGDLFNEPYASSMETYFDGSLSGSEINSRLTDVIADLIHPEFLEEVNSNPKFDELNAAFEENSADEWIPRTRMFMYHGSADITVPYQNSVDTYDRMLSLGADSDIVTFTTLEERTHASGVTPYLESIAVEFDQLK